MKMNDNVEKTAEVNPYAAPESTAVGVLTAEEGAGVKRGWWPGVSLLVIALLAGVGWRMELEMTTGWASMDWIGRFHWAVPAGVVAFIVWVLGVTRVERPRAFAAALVGYGVIGHVVVQRLLVSAFGRAIVLSDEYEGAIMREIMLYKLLNFLLLALVPLLFGILCRGFGVRVRLWSVLGYAILFMLSWPLAEWVVGVVENHSGDVGFIHALKSGYVIPLLVLCLGWPVLRARGK
ncbi:hypothetical protein [Prosthecobacter sp.]|uniref:hypothetical protein n=1 Tax=Prosthecobacter sp. TaxID=1965333 RepID=UPI003782D39A